jgi:hypothetical protein
MCVLQKNPWEWTLNEMIPHSADAVAVTQYTATFFVNGELNAPCRDAVWCLCVLLTRCMLG